MNNFKSKKETQIYELLNNIFPSKNGFKIEYETVILRGIRYKLKIDFVIYYNDQILFYLEYSGMNFIDKFLKLVDIMNRFKNVIVIFDTDDISAVMCKFEQLFTVDWYNRAIVKEYIESNQSYLDFLHDNVYDCWFDSRTALNEKINKFKNDIIFLSKSAI